MIEHANRGSPPRTNVESVVWYISFGDLLTLLVCFFLVLTPWEQLSKREISENSRTINGSMTGTPADGIDLALRALEPRLDIRAEIPIPPCIAGEGIHCSNDIAGAVGREVRTEGQRIKTVAVRVCGDGKRRDEVLEAVLDLLRVPEVDEALISVELHGGSCEEFDVLRPVTGKVAGSIRIM